MDTAIFNRDSTSAFGIAMFNIRSYGATSETVLAAIRERLAPGELIHHHETQFILPGTTMTFTNLIICAKINEITTASVDQLGRTLCGSALILSAVHLRSWACQEQHPVFQELVPVPEGLLTDAEARSLSIHHPEITTRAYFGRDAAGRNVLRTVVIGSIQDEGSSHSSDEAP
jgi:hypothetical protein